MRNYLLLGSVATITLIISCSTSGEYRCESNDLCSSTSEWQYYSCSNDTGHCEKVDPLAIDPYTLPDATIGQSDYTVELTGSGGIPPYAFTLARGDEEKLKWLTLTPEGENKAILHNSTDTNNVTLVPADLNSGIPLALTITFVDSSKHGTAVREDNQGKAFQMTVKINDCPHYCQKISDTPNNPTANENEKKCENNTSYTCTLYYPSANCLKWDYPDYCPQCWSDNTNCCVNECLQAGLDTKCTADGINNAYYVTCKSDSTTGCLVWGSDQTQCTGKICDTSLKVCGECQIDPDYCLQGSPSQCTSDPKKKRVCGYNQAKGCYLWSIIDCESNRTCVEGTCKYIVGNIGPGGGIVFYDNPNYITDGWQYLEAATADQSTGASWGCSGTAIPGSSSGAIGAGKANTKAIVDGCSESGIAAKLCYGNNLGNGYTDWFLPSLNELKQLYNEKSIVGGFSNTLYWSSSSGNSTIYADTVSLEKGYDTVSSKTDTKYVRCVRSGP